MIDSHCHLDFHEFDGRRDEIVSGALKAGVHTMINIGVDLESSEKSAALAERYEPVYAAVGVHPHDAKTWNHPVEKKLIDLADHEKVLAIGEIGLDYYRDLSPRKLQRKVFRHQLDLAVDRRLPVVIHSRESFRDTVETVKNYVDRLKGVFHCFPGTPAEAEEVFDLGFHISVGGVTTFPKATMARVAAEVPLERLLLETDSPYLAPVPFRGKLNQPAYVRYVADKVAVLRDIPVAEVEKITDRNCRKLFGLVDVF